MSYDDPRATSTDVPTYAEDHCALRWPLLLFGTGMPLIVVLFVVLQGVTGNDSFFPLYAVAIFLWALFGASGLKYWPTGIRLDLDGVRIGRVRHAERHPGWYPMKPIMPSLQAYRVFYCPWQGVRAVAIVTDRKELRRIRKRSSMVPKGSGLTAKGYLLGMLVPPHMRAALVVQIDPEVAEFPQIQRRYRALIGTQSTIWVAPTRHPDRIRAALTVMAAAGVRIPDVESRLAAP